MASEECTQDSSLSQDSDEIKEMFCEECKKYSTKYVPAVGFCSECVEYKCETCIMYHQRHFKAHQIQDRSNMPQDFCFENCTVHPNELIKFYCEDCGNIACSECKASIHQNCGSVSHLPSVVQDIEQSEELSNIFKHLDRLNNVIEVTKQEIESNITFVSSQETSEKTKIASHKEELIKKHRKLQEESINRFDMKMEETIAKLKREREEMIMDFALKQNTFKEHIDSEMKAVQKKIDTASEADQKHLQSLMRDILTYVEKLKPVSSDIHVQQERGLKCHLFISMKNANKIMNDIQKKLDSLTVKNQIHFYIAEPRDIELKFENTDLDNLFTYNEIRIGTSRDKKVASFYFDIPISYVGFCSLCMLSNDKLIVANYKNKVLLVYQLAEAGKVSCSEIQLESRPWGITEVKDNEVGVTLPETGHVRLLKVSEPDVDSKSIKVGIACHGIAYAGRTLIISYASIPGKVQEVDLSGNVLKCLVRDNNGVPMFGLPSHLTLSHNKMIIYVSDWDKHTVTSMTLDGEIKAIYKDKDLKNPSQLIVDRSGSVYVCGYGSNNIHQLSSDCVKVKILLDRGRGLCHPVGLTYSKRGNNLLIGLHGKENANVIKVYKLSLE